MAAPNVAANMFSINKTGPGIWEFCVHIDAQSWAGLMAFLQEHRMQTRSVGIRAFRAGLAELIETRQPVAVTRHGQTVGFFTPTPRPSQANLQALRDAAAQLETVMSLNENEVEDAVSDFSATRKAAAARRRKPT